MPFSVPGVLPACVYTLPLGTDVFCVFLLPEHPQPCPAPGEGAQGSNKCSPGGLCSTKHQLPAGEPSHLSLPSLWAPDIISASFGGQSTTLSSLDVQAMLPENLSHFYRYQGSLTTPPCSESVIWTIFHSPIVLSHTQVSAGLTSSSSLPAFPFLPSRDPWNRGALWASLTRSFWGGFPRNWNYRC